MRPNNGPYTVRKQDAQYHCRKRWEWLVLAFHHKNASMRDTGLAPCFLEFSSSSSSSFEDTSLLLLPITPRYLRKPLVLT